MIGRWHTRLSDGRLQCDLCPRHCRLREGQRGYCFVREAREGDIHLSTWGRSSGFAVDPIEKKPLNHFHPATPVLSFGTAGCNLGCRFCQNWEISTSRRWDTLAQVATPQRIASWCADHDIDQVAFTYNDPVVFAEYAVDVADACHDGGIRTVAVTAGWISAPARPAFFDAMDATNIDLKAFDRDLHRRLTGADLDDVLETIAWVAARGRMWMELTSLLIPGLNDDQRLLRAQVRWILDHAGPDVPLHFSAFHPDHRMRDHPPTPPSTLTRAREVALSEGLHHVYTGNVRDRQGGTTRCAHCAEVLIRRDRFAVTDYRLTPAGTCPTCGAKLAGRFGAAPGRASPIPWRACL
ncbi:AmmeMemoRadiSam system radical SAM enzyme [Schaalia sp. 19OD2882]|uniref:AmmeMemoRadiSam system radical SAM enzyme n=1 Tax=Schaalia sp. 19OD2882 TaxID=2794089 RepID=UPI001C1EFD18|nr:AmmeMemoRadiSam system radical SAM enzyme [Schaalia sp. 19OD2882]QWW19027.1 AmmeMemoRadiSam system radical SAM enzyme [Schaalia sp. 19OD2882]